MNIVPAYAGSGNGQNNQLRVITITVEGNGSVQVIVDEKVMLTVGSNETQEYTGNHKESVVLKAIDGKDSKFDKWTNSIMVSQ